MNQSHVYLDLPAGQISLQSREVVWLRDAADAEAGRSVAARDLGVLLTRALSSPAPLALRRAELRSLIEIASRANLGEIAARLGATERDTVS
jgi:hypothetical protein